MEEKERYKLIEEDFGYAIVDIEGHKTYHDDCFLFFNLCDLLNQQDKRIKELEENLKNEKQLHNLCIEDNQKYKDFLRRQILSLMLEIDL